MDIYSLFRNFWDFAFEHPEKIKPNHIAIFSFAIEHCNRLGWKKKFGFPTLMVMDAIGIKSYGTYINALNDLVNWGFITMIEKSKNQYSANIIALSNFDKAHSKALDKALVKHASKQSQSTGQSTHQSTHQSIDSIDKQVYQYTNIPFLKENHFNSDSEFLENWNDGRVKILGVKKSNISKLTFNESEDFKRLKNNYTIEQFKNGIRGLLNQKGIFETMTLRPKHLLEDGNLDKYIDAHLNKKQLYLDSKKLERI